MRNAQVPSQMSGDIIAVILLWISPGCRCVEAVISAAIMLVIVNVSDHNSCSGLDLLRSDLMFACGEQLSSAVGIFLFLMLTVDIYLRVFRGLESENSFLFITKQRVSRNSPQLSDLVLESGVVLSLLLWFLSQILHLTLHSVTLLLNLKIIEQLKVSSS